ncbi:MAG: hypothetical protein EXX96DRAFT_280435 [Benjaminiella poitrasii]|nr:MAG: hypothetical protein EXX96DRAFT_280435 [Benjaminiella poitrasii]
MSFKSKQRAKHGHLFGDDPLNAALVSTSDDPLFAPKKTSSSQSSRTSSPVSNDPLSRLINGESSPLDSSNSTPISTTLSPRRSYAKTKGHSQHSSISSNSNSNSLFGDIDVSKLGTNSGGSKRIGSGTSLRSTATLNAGKQFNVGDDEDLLFGSLRHATKSKTASNSTSSSNLSKKDPTKKPESSSTIVTSPSPTQSEIKKREGDEERKTKVNNEVQTSRTQPMSSPNQTQLEQEKKDDSPIIPTTTSSSSFFRFFKSSNNSKANSKTSSKASSVVSVNPASPKLKNNETEYPEASVSTTSATLSSEAIQTLPPPTTTSDLLSKTIQPQPEMNQNRDPEEIEEDDQSKLQAVIEDEATRAFANDVMTFEPIVPKPDFYYRPIPPELTMDALHISDTNHNNQSKRLVIPSISTPTTILTSSLVEEDPWSETPIINSNLLPKQPSNPDSFLTEAHSTTAPIITTEHSVSTPLIVKAQDIEPQKRRAFADLIASWNTGQSSKSDEDSGSNAQFLEHVAEERRDIGFAGIEGNEQNSDSDMFNRQHTIIPPIVDWAEEENPWN